MSLQKIISWNVNGIRAVMNKGQDKWLFDQSADVICLQEVKAELSQVDPDRLPAGYEVFWNPAKRKGYSGVAILTRCKPVQVHYGIDRPEHDQEGRVIALEMDDCHIVNVYTPNAQSELARLDYRVNHWDIAFRDFIADLDKSKPVIFCGDLNVAHQEIDLANPKSNRRNPGFTDEERQSFTRLLEVGFVDSFRHFEPGPGHYTWWSYRGQARAKNVGWRIDYFGVSESFMDRVQSSIIHPSVTGSDHCPIELQIK